VGESSSSSTGKKVSLPELDLYLWLVHFLFKIKPSFKQKKLYTPIKQP
jgi:hypothetical protein